MGDAVLQVHARGVAVEVNVLEGEWVRPSPPTWEARHQQAPQQLLAAAARASATRSKTQKMAIASIRQPCTTLIRMSTPQRASLATSLHRRRTLGIRGTHRRRACRMRIAGRQQTNHRCRTGPIAPQGFRRPATGQLTPRSSPPRVSRMGRPSPFLGRAEQHNHVEGAPPAKPPLLAPAGLGPHQDQQQRIRQGGPAPRAGPSSRLHGFRRPRLVSWARR